MGLNTVEKRKNLYNLHSFHIFRYRLVFQSLGPAKKTQVELFDDQVGDSGFRNLDSSVLTLTPDFPS